MQPFGTKSVQYLSTWPQFHMPDLHCRNLDNMDDLHFGVHQDMMYARNVPAVQGAQWTGVVTQIAIDMLESGKVDAVICVQNDEQDRFKPKPVSPFYLSLSLLNIVKTDVFFNQQHNPGVSTLLFSQH